jgi:hypothetical protein
MAHLHHSHFIERNDKGLILLRKIVKSEHIEGGEMKGCTKLHTEDIHPFQLFKSMRIESIGESPFQHTTQKRSTEIIDTSVDSEFPRLDRKALSDILTPEKTCDTSYYGNSGCSDLDPYLKCPISKPDPNWQINIGSAKGCAEFSEDLPGSFNFNYDFNTGKAIEPSYRLGDSTGISCDNCYAFLGAGVLIIVELEYSIQGLIFGIEAKVIYFRQEYFFLIDNILY